MITSKQIKNAVEEANCRVKQPGFRLVGIVADLAHEKITTREHSNCPLDLTKDEVELFVVHPKDLADADKVERLLRDAEHLRATWKPYMDNLGYYVDWTRQFHRTHRL